MGERSVPDGGMLMAPVGESFWSYLGGKLVAPVGPSSVSASGCFAERKSSGNPSLSSASSLPCTNSTYTAHTVTVDESLRELPSTSDWHRQRCHSGTRHSGSRHPLLPTPALAKAAKIQSYVRPDSTGGGGRGVGSLILATAQAHGGTFTVV